RSHAKALDVVERAIHPEDQRAVDGGVVRGPPRPERDLPEGGEPLHLDQRQVRHARDRTPGTGVSALSGRTISVQEKPLPPGVPSRRKQQTAQRAVRPPSTTRTCPTTNRDSGEAR